MIIEPTTLARAMASYQPLKEQKDIIDNAGTSPPAYEDAPPPYEHNAIVVTQQPTIVTAARNGRASDNFYILSIVLSVLCCVCGSWVALCCTIPAILYAANAKEAELSGDYSRMKKNRSIALGLNVVGFVAGIVLTICATLFFLAHHDDSMDNNSNYDNTTN